MSPMVITITAWVLLLGGAAMTVLAGLGISDAARSHHFALLAGGVPGMTVGALIIWLQRFGVRD